MLSAICGLVALFVCMTGHQSRNRRIALFVMAISAMLLLVAEHLTYDFPGGDDALSFWMVRISNFFVYLLLLVVLQFFGFYMIDMFQTDLKLPVPRRMYLVVVLAGLGELLVILTQFTGIYYTFDESNNYHRASGYPISYIIPLIVFLLLISVILQYRRAFSYRMMTALLLFSTIPLVAAAIQFRFYGISLISMTLVGMVVILYIISVIDNNRQLDTAQRREVELLKKQHENLARLFSQTGTALVNAIDAKDTYTQGHSARVAKYARRIAEESGRDREECEEIYYAGLLHDVGKIGIPDEIINKTGKLTPEEYDIIKQHSIIGYQILSQISEYPFLCDGARYHHEHYDGNGYPDGLKGHEIPELARILSVADAYDAMTSRRSYRDPLPQEEVRDELIRCAGTQFDPRYAKIMLELMDEDENYLMREIEATP